MKNFDRFRFGGFHVVVCSEAFPDAYLVGAGSMASSSSPTKAAWTGEGEAVEGFNIGEHAYMLNPYFRDGTRLRVGPEKEDAFSDEKVGPIHFCHLSVSLQAAIKSLLRGGGRASSYCAIGQMILAPANPLVIEPSI